ncbi:MAG: DUF192 domain-containing protein, partial [Candidatus Nanoarchaeia archaeon]
MALINVTRNETLDKKVILCGFWWRKALGLMFRRRHSAVFLFTKPRRVPLHMWGVFYSIDVLVLDKTKKVKEIKRGFRPFQFYKPKLPGYYIVEIPTGQLGGTQVGD